MKRISQRFRIIFVLLIISSLYSCAPKVIVKEPAKEVTPYKIYENIELRTSTHFGKWAKTEIYVPRGALIAVMANGEIWDIRKPYEWRWQPHKSLRFKIGEEGREHHIDSGIDRKDPFNLNVVPVGNGGFLYFGMGTWWKFRDPKTRRGNIHVRVIVWEKDRQDQIERDLLRLIRGHPTDRQFRDLISLMANCLGNIGEYQKVQNLYKMMKENPEGDWERVYPTVLNQLSDFERQLGRYEAAKAYSEESLKGVRRYNNRYMESIILRRLGMTASSQKK